MRERENAPSWVSRESAHQHMASRGKILHRIRTQIFVRIEESGSLSRGSSHQHSADGNKLKFSVPAQHPGPTLPSDQSTE